MHGQTVFHSSHSPIHPPSPRAAAPPPPPLQHVYLSKSVYKAFLSGKKKLTSPKGTQDISILDSVAKREPDFTVAFQNFEELSDTTFGNLKQHSFILFSFLPIGNV